MKELTNQLKDEFKDKEYAHAYVNEFLNASIATQIKVLREQRKMTQAELAALAGMQQARISVLENVNNTMWSISTLQRLAEAFDVTLKVSFESFATRINDIQNLERSSLERPSREEALSHMEEPQRRSWAIPFQPGQTVTFGGSYMVHVGAPILLPQGEQQTVIVDVASGSNASSELEAEKEAA